MAETHLSQAIEATNPSGAEYDTNIKYLLADKQVLARILKYTLQEFQDMEIVDIIPCIGNDIEVGTRPLDPGLVPRILQSWDTIWETGSSFTWQGWFPPKNRLSFSTAITTASAPAGPSGYVWMQRMIRLH